jgi:hypothetical protein
MKKIALILSLAIACLSLSAGLLWQDAVAIRQGVNIEWFRTGIDTHDGGAIYVWSDTKLGERDLWAQKVDAAGNLVWGNPLLIDGKPDRQEDPVITRTSDNNYIIAWIDFTNDLDGDVYAQKINAAGQLLWQQGGKPVCTRGGLQIALNIEADMNGGAFIIWVDSRNPSKDLFGQRISSSGDPLWTVNGIPIANGVGDEVQNTMLPDGQGGMMIAYTHSYNGPEDLYAKRFLADGTMAWAEPLPLCTVEGNQSGVRMAALNDGEFVFTWQDQRFANPDIYAQKLNLAGQVLWPNPTIVYGDQGLPVSVSQLNPRIVKTSDNCVIIVWEDHRLNSQNPDLFAQKLSATGTKLWNPAGIALCTAEFAQIGPRMSADNNGGCFVVWDDFRNGNNPNDDIYAQHLSGTGEALWDANGKAICTAPNQQNGSLVKFSGNNVYINWMDLRDGSVGIYFQVLNTAGVPQLENNGKLVFWGLSGDTPKDNYLLLNRSSDVAVIWQDTRFANDGYRIYIQFLNPDGTVDLETNGRPITVSVGGKQLSPHAVVTPDDYIGIVWEDARGNNPKIYAQLIDPNGNKLWGDEGMELTESSPIRQKDAKISYYNGSFYIGWSNSVLVNSTYYYHIYGQRILNGQKMWGNNGQVISVLPVNNQNNECTLYSLIDNYYVWHRVDPSAGTYTIWAKRVDESGAAMPGWLNEGMKASTHDNWDTIQYHPLAQKTPEGIFVMWKDKRDDFIQNYWGQHISASGTRLWDPLGINLADEGREQEQPAVTVTNSGINFTWCENIDGVHDIKASKYSFAGSPLWGSVGYYVVQKDSVQSHSTLTSFDSGNSVVAWVDFYGDESDLYYKYVSADGIFSGSIYGNALCEAKKAQYQPVSLTLNEQAYIMWADGRSSGKTEILGLYAQKLSSSVSVSDNNTPSLSSIELKQNHPNPFNPQTTISFTLKNNSPALELKIYNLKGQMVKNLMSGSMNRGSYNLVWDGKDDAGNNVSSGVYFYRLSDGKSTQQRKMVLMK